MELNICVNNQELKYGYPSSLLNFMNFLTQDEDIVLNFNFDPFWEKEKKIIKIFNNQDYFDYFILESKIFKVPKEYYRVPGFSFCLQNTKNETLITTNFLLVPIKEVFKCI